MNHLDYQLDIDYDSSMPGDFVDPESYDFKHRFATTLKSLRTVCNLLWTCPHCGATNDTSFDGARVRRSYSLNVEAKCGKCHGQVIGLLDSKGCKLLLAELLGRSK